MIENCRICNELFLGNHKCPPLWNLRIPNWDEDDGDFQCYANFAGSAAEIWMERNHPKMDYIDFLEIWVRKHEDDEWQKFNVNVKMEPVFTATLKQAP